MSSSPDSWNPTQEAFKSRHFNPDLGQRGRSTNGKKFSLYVSGIPVELSSGGLRNLFESYGQVIGAKILPTKNNYENQCGFIEYGTLREAESAIRNLNGSHIGRYMLRVSHTRSQKKNEQPNFDNLLQKVEKGPLIDAHLKDLLNRVDQLCVKKYASDKKTSNGSDDKVSEDSIKAEENVREISVFDKEENLLPPNRLSSVNSSPQSQHKVVETLMCDNTTPENLSNSINTHCSVCKKPTPTVCSSCGVMYYCSKSCQLEDRHKHKKICKLLAEERMLDKDEPMLMADGIADCLEKIFKDALCDKRKTESTSEDCKISEIDDSSSTSSLSLPETALSPGDVVDFIVTDLDVQSCSILCQSADKNTRESLSAMQVDLNTHYSSKPCTPLSNVRVGKYCAAVFSEDNCWYRAVVRKLNDDNTCLVNFIDYGNSELKQHESLKVLDENFLSQSKFCFTCKLAGLESSPWSSSVVAFLTKTLHVNELHITAEIVHVTSSCIYVECLSGNTSLNHELLQQGLIKPVPTGKHKNGNDSSPKINVVTNVTNAVQDLYAFPKLNGNVQAPLPKHDITTSSSESDIIEFASFSDLTKINVSDTKFSVVLTHVESPSKFYCQVVQRDLIELKYLSEQLAALFASGKRTVDFTPSIGQICAGFFTEDGLWHRCEVLAFLDSGLYKVFYIDFGNTDALSKDQVQPLPLSLTALPVQAFKAGLSNCYPFSGGDWNDDATLVLKSCQNTSLEAQVDKASTTDDFVSLTLFIDEDVTFNDHLVFSKLATRKKLACDTTRQPVKDTGELVNYSVDHPLESGVDTKRCEYIEQLQPEIGNKTTIKITSSSQGGMFYCQLAQNGHKFDDMMTSLLNYCDKKQTKAILDPTQGLYCAVYSDKTWKRGLIKARNTDGIQIYFLDYGDSAFVDEKNICELPAEYGSLPMQAIHCQLADVAPFPIPPWSTSYNIVIASCMLKPLDAKFVSKNEDRFIVKVPLLVNLLIKSELAEYSM